MTDQAASVPAKFYLFGPFVDFLCLGGLTLLLIPIWYYAPPEKAIAGSVAFVLSTYLINDSHFLSTYQIYYRDFRRKAFAKDISPIFRLRYLFAGVLFPAAMIAFVVYAILQPEAVTVGYLGNLMLFLVLWHYMKQAYGVLIIDSVYKKCFLTDFEKRVFRYNSLACWILFWLMFNRYAPSVGDGKIMHTNFKFPPLLLGSFVWVAVASSLMVLFVMARRVVRRQALPFNGISAYLITVYLWGYGLFDPVARLIIPGMHGLQYHAVVWRYKINHEEAMRDVKTPLAFRLTIFGVLSLILGYLGFAGVPNFLDAHVKYDQAIFGTALFIFAFQSFINIHHFIMDGVIWHHTNPDTAKYLFRKKS